MDCMETIAKIAADPAYRLNLEKRGDSYRVRYCLRQKGGERPAVVIPHSLVRRVERLIRQSRSHHDHIAKARRIAAAMKRQEERRVLKPLLDGLLQKMLAASPHGRVVRERIKQGFKRAVVPGLDAPEGYGAWQPGGYQGRKPGRPGEAGECAGDLRF